MYQQHFKEEFNINKYIIINNGYSLSIAGKIYKKQEMKSRNSKEKFNNKYIVYSIIKTYHTLLATFSRNRVTPLSLRSITVYRVL